MTTFLANSKNFKSFQEENEFALQLISCTLHTNLVNMKNYNDLIATYVTIEPLQSKLFLH